jgi:hypothetical protein
LVAHFVPLGAVHVCHEEQAPGIAVRSRLERPCPQASLEGGGEHAHAHLLDDPPDTITLINLGHGVYQPQSSAHGSPNAVPERNFIALDAFATRGAPVHKGHGGPHYGKQIMAPHLG